MNIDANITSGPPVPVAKAGNGSARQRAAGEAGADSMGKASFVAMLLAQAPPAEDPGLSGVDGATPSGQGLAADDGEAASDADAGWPDVASPLGNPAPAASVPAQPDAAAVRAAGADAVSACDAHADDAGAAASAADAQELQAWRAAVDGAANTGAKKQGAAAADASTLGRQQATELAMAAREGAGRADTAALAKDATESSAWRALVTPQAGASAVAIVSMFEAGLIGLRAGPGGRVQERGAARGNSGPESASGGFVPWMDAGSGNSVSQPASPVYAPTAATPVPAAALAQKLHFWVAGGVQSAELQLEAFDGGSVDVHIAVKGDEAYVEFRSDQPQARKLLLDAMPQLKDLLAGEGLILSGGFVGGSAQHPAGGDSARRDRFSGAARPAQERVVDGPVAVAPSVRVAMGSSVDLFV